MGGIYCFLGKLLADEAMRIGSLGDIELEKGYYAYVGSAMKGLDARLDRHARLDKKVKWHIDHLTTKRSFIPMTAMYALTRLRRAEHSVAMGIEGQPIEGFGCTDCECTSHLFYLGEGLTEARKTVERALSSVGLDHDFLEWAKCVVLDLDGTLVDYGVARRAALLDMADRIGVNGSDFLEEYFSARNQLYGLLPADPRKYSKELVFELLSKGLNLHLDPTGLEEMYWMQIIEHLEAFPDAAPTMSWLRNEGFEVYVFSDGLKKNQEAKLESTGLAILTSRVSISEDLGVNKADPGAYDLFLQEWGLRGEDVVMVGDSLIEDVESAQRSGVRGILLARDGSTERGTGSPQIRNLEALRVLLRLPQRGQLAQP